MNKCALCSAGGYTQCLILCWARSWPILCGAMDCSPPGFTGHGIFQARILEWVAYPLPQATGSSSQESSIYKEFKKRIPSPEDLPNSGIEPRSSTWQADSLPSEPPGKPKNTGVGSLSLLHQIFLAQELNQGLLHCRQILYQLSYQGSPYWQGCSREKVAS